MYCCPFYFWLALVSFLAHLSGRLKSAFLITFWPASIFLSLKLFTFSFFFSRTTGLISIILSWKHPMVKGIQVHSNKGPHHSPRGDNCKRVKTHWNVSKPFREIQPKSVQSITELWGLIFLQIKNHTLLSKIIAK